MGDTDMDTDTITDTDNHGIFDSCEAFGESAKNNDYWCWNTEEGDYSQIWTVLGLVYIMYAAQFILFYISLIHRFMRIRAINIPIQSTESMIPFPTIIYHDNKSNGFIILLANVVVHVIYIFIRISLLMSNHLSTVNEQFASMEFQQFINARNILLIVILRLVPSAFIINYVVLRRKDNVSNESKLQLLGYILLTLDAIFILIAFCVYYSLLVGVLYLVAIGLLVQLMAVCILICFSVLFMAMFTKCCVNCQCIRITENDVGDVVIEFPGFGTQFVLITLKIFFLFVVIFGVATLQFFFVWYFLGGPPHAVFYTDFSQYEDDMIYWLFIFATVMSVAALFWELINLWMTYYHEERNQSGIHRQISNDSDN